LVACSKANAMHSNLGSVHARPKNEIRLAIQNQSGGMVMLAIPGNGCRGGAITKPMVSGHPIGQVCRGGRWRDDDIEVILIHCSVDAFRAGEAPAGGKGIKVGLFAERTLA